MELIDWSRHFSEITEIPGVLNSSLRTRFVRPMSTPGLAAVGIHYQQRIDSRLVGLEREGSVGGFQLSLLAPPPEQKGSHLWLRFMVGGEKEAITFRPTAQQFTRLSPGLQTLAMFEVEGVRTHPYLEPGARISAQTQLQGAHDTKIRTEVFARLLHQSLQRTTLSVMPRCYVEWNTVADSLQRAAGLSLPNRNGFAAFDAGCSLTVQYFL
jgi:hypothetical protein